MLRGWCSLVAVLAATSACYTLSPSKGGGQVPVERPPPKDPHDVALLEGYSIALVAEGLTFPTGVAFDAEGRPHVVEAGYSYGERRATPRLLRVEAGGRTAVIASGKNNGPWNGVAFSDGAFFVAEGGEFEGGRILRIGPDGTTRVLVAGLPSLGDHHTNGPVVGADGFVYFGQGTATNSAVVGPDNHDFGWLRRHPGFHDVPCKDVALAGVNYLSTSPLPDLPGAVMTGAYSPYGTPTKKGQVIPGALLCSGAVMRVPKDGGDVELVAWGFRNPYGLAFSPEGKLFVTENGFDQRGSRPVFGAGDVLWEVEPGAWYGWPDHAFGKPVATRRFKPPGKEIPRALLAALPGTPPSPKAIFAVHSSSNGFDFSRSPAFGFVGEAFVAQFGDMASEVGKVMGPVGFKVVRVDTKTGVIRDFAVNRAESPGPASRLGSGGLERPVAVRFDPSGDALYVVDFGAMFITDEGPVPMKETGALWKITRGGAP